jgi:UDP-glucose 4-epimerase
MRGVELVIHLAALLHVSHVSARLVDEYQAVNVGGTSTVVETAIRAGVARLVFFSTIAVYGGSEDQIFTEEIAPQPRSIYARTKLDAEKLVLEAKREDGVPLGTVLRLAAVYGSRVKGNYRRLLQSLARRRFLPIGEGRNRRTLVYDRDAAKAALLAAQSRAAAGRIYNVTDGRYHTMEETIRAICYALGRKAPALSLPVGPTRWAAGMLEDLAGLVHLRSPLGRSTIDKYTEDLAVSGERIQEELAFVPEYDLARGWTETIFEMRQSGEL